jgi:inhibitor of cysteine peptidase
MQKEIKKKARTYGVIAILLALILGVLCYNLGFVPQIPLTSASTLKTFASEAELKNFLKSNANRNQYAPLLESSGTLNPWIPSLKNSNVYVFSAAAPASNPSTQAGSFALSGITDNVVYSTTNVQVAGVDELDTVKTDGEYIYTVSGNTVFIVNASLPNAGVVSRILFDDFAPAGIFVSGDRLAVVGSNYSFPVITPFSFGTYKMGASMYVSESQTCVRVYNVFDRANPTLLRNFTMTGDYLDSRMIGDYVYLVATTPAYLLNETVIHPTIYSNDSATEVPATQIYYSNVPDAYLAYSTFVALNVHDASEKPSTMTIMTGQASKMYVSLSNIYVTFPDNADGTTVCRVQVHGNNLTAVAQGEVPGQVLNQFSMDEYGDYFRVATSKWTQEAEPVSITNPVGTPIIMSVQSTNVYVLNMNLTVVGRLENISMGENFHATRFAGDRCYLVTFQATDPLFVVDLTHPTSPTILGNLTVSGYSDYLQPYDENHLIGVGKETVAAENGYFAWYQGIKIAMFDVTNVSNPVQMSNVTIGDRGSDSPVLYDHKALLFNKQQDLLVIPVTVAEINQSLISNGMPPEGAYGTQVWQGVYVYNITLSNGLVLKGNVTHADTTGLLSSTFFINRALYIGDILYTVSQAKIELNSLADLSLLKEISLS